MSGGPSQQTTTTRENGQTSSTSNLSGATNVAGTVGTTQNVALPDYLQPFIQGVPGVAETALTDLTGKIGNYQVPPEALAMLKGTLGNDYLYGGQAFDEAVQAAQRAAMPGILSTFGAAGRGTGGLAEHAIAQSGIDAFSRLFDSERNRQLQAAQLLPQLSTMPINLQNMLLQNTLSIPQAFQSLYGQTGMETRDLRTEMEQQQGMTGTSKSTAKQTQPLYQPGPLDYALAGVGLLGSFV
jgi:hypothetical protein